MSKQITAIAAALLLGAGVGGAVGAAVAHESDSGSGGSQAATAANEPVVERTSSTAALYKRVKDAVVEVHAAQGASETPFGQQGPGGEATGSGFVIDSDGHIVTNQHVVDGADSVQVQFSDGSTASAQVVGTDPSTDVAVLDVDKLAS